MMTKVSYLKKIIPETVAGVIVFAVQEFSKGADGSLMHYTDGKLRASVPSEGMQQYAEQWPDCAPVVAYLKGGANTLRVPKKTATAKKGGK